MAIQWLLMAFKGLLVVIQGLLRAIQGLYSRPSGAAPSPCGSSLAAAPPYTAASGSCLRPGTRGHVTAAPGTGQPERPVGSQGVSVGKAALSRGRGARLGAAPAAGGSRGLLPAGPSPGSSQSSTGARQSTPGARPPSLGTALGSALSLCMDFSRLCVRCAQAAEAQHSSCQRPRHCVLHPNSVIWQECGMRLLGPGVLLHGVWVTFCKAPASAV